MRVSIDLCGFKQIYAYILRFMRYLTRLCVSGRGYACFAEVLRDPVHSPRAECL